MEKNSKLVRTKKNLEYLWYHRDRNWIAGNIFEKIIPDDGFIGKPWGIKIKILRIKPDEIKKLDKRTISKNNLKKSTWVYMGQNEHFNEGVL